MSDALIPPKPDKELLPDGSLWIGKKPPPGAHKPRSETSNLVDNVHPHELNELMEYLARICQADYESYRQKFTADARALKQLGMNITSRGQLNSINDNLAEGVSVPPAFLQSFIDTSVNLTRALYPLNGVVDTRIYGPETTAAVDVSERKMRATNYYFNQKYSDYRNVGEMVNNWSILTGSCAKKITTNYHTGMPTVKCIEPSHFILPPEATSIHDAERILEIVEISDLQWRRLQDSGYFKRININPNTYTRFYDAQVVDQEKMKVTGIKTDDRHDLLKRYSLFQVQLMWCFKSLGDRSAIDMKSYIVTFDPVSRQCIRIEENFDRTNDTSHTLQRYVLYRFFPGFSGLGLGLLHLSSNLCSFSTQLHDLLLQAGQYVSKPSGILSSALGIDSTQMTFKPGSWTKIPALPPLGDSMQVVFGNEPSPTLKDMYAATEENIRSISNMSSAQLSDISSQQGQSVALTLLNLLMQRPNAILERYYQSLSEELSLINDHIYYNWSEESARQLGSGVFGENSILQEDFSPLPTPCGEDEKEDFFVVSLVPATGTGMKNSSYRLLQADMVIQLASQAPDIHNLRTVYEEMYKLLEFTPEMIDKILPSKEKEAAPPPFDPLTENQRLITGQPVQPYPFQDQQAYIAVNSLLLSYPDETVQEAAKALIAQREALWLMQSFQQADGTAMPENLENLSTQDQNTLAIKAADLIQKGVLVAPWMPPPAPPAETIDPSQVAMHEIEVQQREGAAKRDLERNKLKQQEVAKDREFELDSRRLALEEKKVLSQQLMDEIKLGLSNQMQQFKMQMEKERIEAESLRTLVKELQAQIEMIQRNVQP